MSKVVGVTRFLIDDESGVEEAALRAAGARKIARDVSKASDQAELAADLVAGDVVIVTSGLRLAPTLQRFITAASELSKRGVHVRVLHEPALSSDASVDAAEVIQALERLRHEFAGLQTREGMARAAAQRTGRSAGRPTVMTPDRLAMARELKAAGRPISHIARVLGVSNGAVIRSLKGSAGGVT